MSVHKMSYREVMDHVKTDKVKLSKVHIDLIKRILENSDMYEKIKEYERLNIEELELKMREGGASEER